MSERSHIPCPDPNCGSSDAYSWNEADQKGYCHSCSLATWVYDGKFWGKRNGTRWIIEEDVDQVEIAVIYETWDQCSPDDFKKNTHIKRVEIGRAHV